jgi:ketosteroid isomerase-like protein
MTPRTASQARSKSHHVAVGLGFWVAFKKGDLEACVEALHPDVEWHPTPRLAESEVVRGREDVCNVLQVMHDRFSNDLDVIPEDGRQVGDHVLMVTMLSGRNQFTKHQVKSRECWVVSIRDDKMGRIVVYPNAPAARLGFEEVLNTAPAETNRSTQSSPAVRLAPEMENSTATPAEVANDQSAGNQVTLTFTFEEAEALNRWMLKPSQDGALAADDAAVRPGLMKIRTAVEHAQAISAVRHELEQAGVPTQHLSDQQVAQLGRRISQAAPRLGGAQG